MFLQSVPLGQSLGIDVLRSAEVRARICGSANQCLIHAAKIHANYYRGIDKRMEFDLASLLKMRVRLWLGMLPSNAIYQIAPIISVRANVHNPLVSI